MTIELLTVGFYIAAVLTMFIDGSGVVEWFKEKLYYLRYTKDSPYNYYQLKPFDCSKCMSFWSGIGYYIYLHPTLTIETLITAVIFGTLTSLMALTLRRYIVE